MPPWVDPNTHGWVQHPASDADWLALLREHGGEPGQPLEQVFASARAGRCRTVVIESRYVDADYRSEYSAFWSKRFQGAPPFARRLHFFRRLIHDAQLDALPRDPGYIGYAVVPPVPQGRVGRALLAPPRRMRAATLALVRDDVTLFGNALSVEGVPFTEQDGEFLRCAHAAAWMCHYSAYRRGLTRRHVSAELVDMSPSLLLHERPLPSKGMNLNQLQAVFGETGQPALFYGLTNMPSVRGVEDPTPRQINGEDLAAGFWDTRIFSVASRYLNSGFPVLVATDNHAFVLVGWFRQGTRIRFIATDDQVGPYEVIGSPFTDHRAPWQSLMVPLPPKVFLSGEGAENFAHLAFRAYGSSSGAPASLTDLAQGVADKSISLRTFLRDHADYKAVVERQGRPRSSTRLLRLARLPHYVWVVEAHDRSLRGAGRPCVIAECVFDSTSSDRSPRLDAISLPGISVTFPPDGAKREAAIGGMTPWNSQLVAPA